MATNVIQFPMHRVTPAPINAPTELLRALRHARSTYARRLDEGFDPDSLRMRIIATAANEYEARLADFSAELDHANDNIIPLRRA